MEDGEEKEEKEEKWRMDHLPHEQGLYTACGVLKHTLTQGSMHTPRFPRWLEVGAESKSPHTFSVPCEIGGGTGRCHGEVHTDKRSDGWPVKHDSVPLDLAGVCVCVCGWGGGGGSYVLGVLGVTSGHVWGHGQESESGLCVGSRRSWAPNENTARLQVHEHSNEG